MPKEKPRDEAGISSTYRLETVTRACTILREFEDDQQMLSLNDIVKRTGLERTICFRLLHTLEQERFLRRVAGRRYACNIRLLTQKRFRIAYASQTVDSFSNAVGQGLRWAASEHQVDLVEIGNHYSAKTALRNAETLIKQRVDLVIEFQVYYRIGAQLSHLFEEAGIPVIALAGRCRAAAVTILTQTAERTRSRIATSRHEYIRIDIRNISCQRKRGF